MDFFKILILFGAVSGVICGGESNCGVLENDAIALLQAFESLIYGIVNLVNNSVNSAPFVGGSSIQNYFCSINATTYNFAMEISRMSGLNIDYILGAFDGSISQPFMQPLDCISSEIMSYYALVENITATLVPEWETLVQESPINESTPCSTVLQIQAPYFQRDIQTATIGLNAGINRASTFSNIGKLNLYLNYMDSLRICSENTLVDNIAEILNIDESIVSEFLANQSIAVPQPLSCIQGLVSSLSNLVNSTYSSINNTIVNPSTSTNCEPFYSQLKEFEGFWNKYISDLLNHAINQSVEYPELTPFFTSSLLCEVDAMVLFAANATSYLSGVDSDIIYNILLGNTAPPFMEPLDCIANELFFMSNQISTLVNSIIPGIQNFAVNSTSDTSSCNATYKSLTPYVGKMVKLMNDKGVIMTNATIDFKSISLDDLFLEALATVIDCLPNLMGKYVGAALNSNSAAVTAFVSGNRSSLPYPLSCVRIIINILDSVLNQALVNFATDSAANVVVAPKVPVFRG